MITKKKIKKQLDKFVTLEKPIVKNINRDYTIVDQKKVLICYLNYNIVSYANKSGVKASNQLEFFQIIKCFIEMNFVIDVCAGNDLDALDYIAIDDYDFVFGFGAVFRYVSSIIEERTILYMTENPFYVSDERSRERYEYFGKRHSNDVEKLSNKHKKRTGGYYLDKDEQKAEYIICLGDETYYPKDKRVYRLCPSGLKNQDYKLDPDRRSLSDFIVFSSCGIVHKGIDLLIEVFSELPDMRLHICGESAIKELRELNYIIPDNVIIEGFVDVNSPRYIELMNECAYTVLPSCSEATSTGVITGMRHGLIPIITRGNGFELFKDKCIFFNDYILEDIKSILKEAASMNRNEYILRSREVYEYSNIEFSLETFSKNMKKILREICK